MTTLDEVRTLRGTALRLLPGVCQARGHLNMLIEVLEYFARDAEHELTTGQLAVRPIDKKVLSQMRILKALMSACLRLHQPRD